MKRTMKIALAASVVLAAAATTAGLQAQQSAMTFFITSAGSGNGGNLGGLEGADAHLPEAGDGRRRRRQDLARLPQHHRREVRQCARPHRPRTLAEREGRDRRPHPRRPAQRQEQSHQADRAHRDRPGGQRPRRQAEHARHPHRLVAGRPRGRRRREGHDLQQLDQRRRRLGHRRTSRPPGPRHVAAGDLLEFVARLEGLQPAGAGLDRRQRPALLLRVELISVSRMSTHGRRAISPAAVAFERASYCAGANALA